MVCVCVCDVSVENLDTFVEQLLDGQLTPYLKSEPVPTSNDDPVKVGCTRLITTWQCGSGQVRFGELR